MRKLTRRLLGGAAAVVVVTAATTVATTTAASATTGTPSGAPPDDMDVWCVSTTGAKACFKAYGDKVWVKDTVANGQSAAGTIKEDASPSGWYRECFNTRGADGGWVMCDFDVPEYSAGVLWAVNNPFIGSQASTKIQTTII
ncbi:MAG TPA: hypothetical protein VIQ79_07270 [Kribbella sp.]